MTDYKEEQEGELEALRSIYPEDELKSKMILSQPHACVHVISRFAVISEDPYCYEVKVTVEDSEIEGGQGEGVRLERNCVC